MHDAKLINNVLEISPPFEQVHIRKGHMIVISLQTGHIFFSNVYRLLYYVKHLRSLTEPQAISITDGRISIYYSDFQTFLRIFT